jgi:hypothetical protein
MLFSSHVVLLINLAQLHYVDTGDGCQRLWYVLLHTSHILQRPSNNVVCDTWASLVYSGANVLLHASHNLRGFLLNLWLAHQQ